VLQLRGALLPNFQNTFGVSESLLGLVAPMGTLGFTVTVLAVGLAAGHLPIKNFLVAGAIITTAGIFLMGLSPVYPALLLFLVLRGLGSGLFRGLDRPLLNHLYPGQFGRIYNLHAAAWALGAASGPLVANFILSLTGNWRIVYLFYGSLLVPLLFYLFTRELDTSQFEETQLSWKKLKQISRRTEILGMFIGIVLNVGIEAIFFTWLPFYLSGIFSHGFGNTALSLFLLAYVPGRLISSWLSEKIDLSLLALLNSLFIAAMLIMAFLFTSGYLSVAFILLSGFSLSSNFPTLLSFGTKTSPSLSGPINALAMTCSALALSAFPPLFGLITEYFSITVAMKMTVVLAVGLIANLVVLRTKLSLSL
ncbi:MFS transporter, partial [Candidatus Bipolaricaulota bacterium]|nr:MFS transporter [Candidatus Bipolaricaulota bacterium]